MQVPPNIITGHQLRVDHQHDATSLLGWHLCLPYNCCAVLQCSKSDGQESDGDETAQHRNRIVSFQVDSCTIIVHVMFSILSSWFSRYSSRVYLPSITAYSKRGNHISKINSLHSFNLLWLLWTVCGGIFITIIIHSNWLAVTIKPKFADNPVDTAQVTFPLDANIQDLYLIKRMCLREASLLSWSLVTKCGNTWWKRCPHHTQIYHNKSFLLQTGVTSKNWSMRTYLKRKGLYIDFTDK